MWLGFKAVYCVYWSQWHQRQRQCTWGAVTGNPWANTTFSVSCNVLDGQDLSLPSYPLGFFFNVVDTLYLLILIKMDINRCFKGIYILTLFNSVYIYCCYKLESKLFLPCLIWSSYRIIFAYLGVILMNYCNSYKNSTDILVINIYNSPDCTILLFK